MAPRPQPGRATPPPAPERNHTRAKVPDPVKADGGAGEVTPPVKKSRGPGWFSRNRGLLAVVAIMLAGVTVMVDGWERRDYLPPPVTSENASYGIIPGQLMMEVSKDISDGELAEMASRHGIDLRRNSPGSQIVVGKLPGGGAVTNELLEKLRAENGVENASPDQAFETKAPAVGQAFPDDPYFGKQWNLHKINIESAWEYATGKGTVVAVIDSGVMIQSGPGSILLDDLRNTANVAGYDFLENDTVPQDTDGHGSHVAGTIAQSTNNGEGVAGVAYEASIMPLRVGAQRIELSDIADSVRWAADNGAHIINMSLGGPVPDPVLQSAVDYAHGKGLLVICAAGNESRHVSYPAACNNAMAVSAVDVDLDFTSYSNFGEQIAIAAPGGGAPPGLLGMVTDIFRQATDVNTLIVQQTVVAPQGGMFGSPNPGPATKVGYQGLAGTSMACPHVAGVAALVHSLGVTDPDEIRTILRKSAMPKGPPEQYGAGVLDAGAAVRLASRRGGIGLLNSGGLGLALFVGVFVAMTKGTGAVAKFVHTHAHRLIPFGVGLFLPTAVAGWVGASSMWNLVGHSAALPLAWLFFFRGGKQSLQILTWFALGLGLHLLIDVQANTAPMPVLDYWRLRVWLFANLIAVGYVVLRVRRDGRADEPLPAAAQGARISRPGSASVPV